MFRNLFMSPDEAPTSGGAPVSESPAAQAPAPSGGAEGGAGPTPPAPDSTEGTPPPGQDGVAPPAAAAAAAYKAREKFKVMVFGSDAQKEENVPDWLKPLMKDADSEKQVIELLEKAHGLDGVKQSRQQIRQERDQIKTSFNQMKSSIDDVRQTYQRGDIDLFLKKLAIPEERMLQWALDKVNYSQLPPEQQKVFDERTEAQRRAYAAEQQLQRTNQQSEEAYREAKQNLLTSSLARPDTQSFAAAYDARVGKPGAFREEVILQGDIAWHQSQGKEDLTPDQAVERAIAKWKGFIQPAQPPVTPTAQGQAAGPGTPPPAAAAKPQVIPNLQGKSQSPMKSGPRSIEDLKKIREASAR